MNQLTWITAFWPSLFYFLRSIDQDREVTDRALLELLRLADDPQRAGTLTDEFWSRIIVAAAHVSASGDHDDQVWRGSVRELVATTRVDGPLANDTSTRRAPVDRLIKRFEMAGAELRRQRPHLETELPLRIRPLQEQWLARGPGLLRQVDRWIGMPRPTTEPIRVIAVIPLTGGEGQAYPAESAVLIEAVLTNSDERLPELLRLAWLVTQIRLPAPDGTTTPFGPSLRHQLAALLLALAVGQHLDWFAQSPPPLTLALESWLRVPAQLANQATAALPADWSERVPSHGDLGLFWDLADDLARDLT